jgi:hypothetical protein
MKLRRLCSNRPFMWEESTRTDKCRHQRQCSIAKIISPRQTAKVQIFCIIMLACHRGPSCVFVLLCEGTARVLLPIPVLYGYFFLRQVLSTGAMSCWSPHCHPLSTSKSMESARQSMKMNTFKQNFLIICTVPCFTYYVTITG